MERLIERVCGLDVHKQSVAACVRVPGPEGTREQHVRTFGTTGAELLALRDWLEARGVTHVAMESTGVYWKPVWYVLEEAVRCLLVNPAQVKQVPGRKTDVADCVWLAQLLEHGLLRGSFVPPAPIRELRDLTRYRKVLIQERTREANRLHKVLEDAGVKLASVATDILGASGRAMLEALVHGTTDPAVLADRARSTAGQTPGPAPGPGGAVSSPPRLSRQPAPGSPGLPRRGHRDAERPRRGDDGPVR
jgi:transposase